VPPEELAAVAEVRSEVGACRVVLRGLIEQLRALQARLPLPPEPLLEQVRDGGPLPDYPAVDLHNALDCWAHDLALHAADMEREAAGGSAPEAGEGRRPR
jgi:hypothetical protein